MSDFILYNNGNFSGGGYKIDTEENVEEDNYLNDLIVPLGLFCSSNKNKQNECNFLYSEEIIDNNLFDGLIKKVSYKSFHTKKNILPRNNEKKRKNTRRNNSKK
jgi:hypothetical protein